MPALALIFHLIDGVDAGTRGPVSRAAAAQAAAWCEYLAAHARRLYAAVTDAARVAAALLRKQRRRLPPARWGCRFNLWRREAAPSSTASLRRWSERSCMRPSFNRAK